MYGIVLAVIGMMIFNVGLTYGLSKLGGQSGSLIPSAFCTIESGAETIKALYPYFAGVGVALFFAFVLGFGATLAEPALNALGFTVQNLTNGVFKKIGAYVLRIYRRRNRHYAWHSQNYIRCPACIHAYSFVCGRIVSNLLFYRGICKYCMG